VEVRCRFQNLISARDAGVEIISQFHPLIRFITDELNESGHGCFPLVAVLVRQSVGGAQRLQRGTFAFTLSHWSFVGVKTEEDLHVRAVRLRDGEDLSSGESFDLLNTARLHGMDWPEAAGELATAEVRSAIDTALLLGVADFEAERTLKQNENHDRAAFQIASLERHLQRKRTRHLDLRDSHIAAGRKGLARAEERKLRTLEEAFETKREGLQRKVRLDSTRFEVCAGVIRVE
jgi:hypothetical protein